MELNDGDDLLERPVLVMFTPSGEEGVPLLNPASNEFPDTLVLRAINIMLIWTGCSSESLPGPIRSIAGNRL